MRDELPAGLNMLNTTNLDYFGAHHQAEIFRLKGVFLQVGACGRGVALACRCGPFTRRSSLRGLRRCPHLKGLPLTVLITSPAPTTPTPPHPARS
jgi:hypothetical protein